MTTNHEPEECGNEDAGLDDMMESRLSGENGFYPTGDEESHGWPGDGSGEDDLADYNASEADDYQNE